MVADPYTVLGVPPAATDAEVRSAYRKLVQRHHPDHNGGSAESARRFEEVQEAYAAVRALRGRPAAATSVRGARAGGASAGGASAGRASAGATTPGGGPAPDLDARLAEMERELQAARAARERAVRNARRAQEQAAREAAKAAARGTARPGRPSDEELGYYSTEDSFTKILDDVAEELTDRWTEARKSPAGHRLSDLIDDLAGKLTGERHEKR